MVTQRPSAVDRKTIKKKKRTLTWAKRNCWMVVVVVVAVLLSNKKTKNSSLTTASVVMTQAVVYTRVTIGISMYSCRNVWKAMLLFGDYDACAVVVGIQATDKC